MVFKIEPCRIDVLKKKVATIARKGVAVVFNIVGEGYASIDKLMKRKYIEVEVNAYYKINGFEFVGVIEHKQVNGVYENIIRPAFNCAIPARFRKCAPYCEHCKTTRYRKDTYIIRNTQTGEFMQVGSACLCEYTNGLDASVCAQYYECMLYCENIDIYSEGFEGFKDDSAKYFNSNLMKSLMYNYIKENGYNKDKFVGGFVEYMTNCTNKVNNNFVNDFDSYVSKLSDYNDYNLNLQTICKCEYIETRDFKLLASGIFKYINYIATQKSEAKSTYLGNVGERNGVKQTTISRGSLIKTAKKATAKGEPASKGFDSLLQTLN